MAGTEQVLVPDIGDFDDVPVIEVLVSVGDEVAAEDPLVVLESDKATMEVPSPSAGKVAAIEIAVGDKVKEGSPILTLELSSNGNRAHTPSLGTVADVATAAQSEPARIEAAPAAAAPASPQAGTGANPAYASPGVRRLARELGIDLSTVRGTGRKGRITKEDLHDAEDRARHALERGCGLTWRRGRSSTSSVSVRSSGGR